ncbi:MAG: DNA cytosine methyltransferase [Christensenellaceae bacterium]|jgi:DNA (cytosine-5)-methyltransferase 1|nr:DNA cytosine methyltransferase [Christensenellaceae bacterium]
MKIASLFAGIGGIDLGFQQAGFIPAWANEIDEVCAQTFRLNHIQTKLVVDDINNVKASDIPAVTVLAGGFPCQAFSIAGHKKGFADNRGSLFFQITRLLEEMKEKSELPQVVFLENVKNMYTHDNGNTYKVIKKKLEDIGYHVVSKVLNSSEYGNLPQNRERIYIIAFLDKAKFDRFRWPSPIELSESIDKLICWNTPQDRKYYYTPKMKCYTLLKENIRNKNSIYQYRRVYVRENKSSVCPTLTANMGMGGHNVPLIVDGQGSIRKLTPRECLSLQGFPPSFKIPQGLTDTKVYKQAGNSVSVPVIKRLAEEIYKVLK